MSEPKPSIEEIRNTLGKLASCFSIPASPRIHRVNVVRPVEEVETIYLEALDVLRRSHE